jgi:transcriptional regulator with XRE-family HTH domain
MTLMTGTQVPTFHQGDWLRKAREHAGLEKQQLADEIGIHRASVARYESGEQRVKRPVLIAWAMVTGVPLEWLETGVVRPEGFEPPAY